MHTLKYKIINYLKSDIDSAIVINGKWGIGKTYGVQKLIKNKDLEIEWDKDARKVYLPIYISLFGVSSVSDIQQKILIELYPFLKTKTFKTSYGIAKTLFRGFINYNQIGNLDEYCDLPKNEIRDSIINYERLVLVFDDFERKHSDLKIQELLGFINQLVEHDNCKVAIITNEFNISEDEQIDYKKFKEKICSLNYEVKADLFQTYDDIVSLKHNGFPVFKDFLIKYKSTILNVFQSGNYENIRTLIFILNYTQNVFTFLNSDSNLPQKESDKEIINKSILVYLTAVSIEFKEGNISFTNSQNTDNQNLIQLEKLFSNQKRDEKKLFSVEFQEKYAIRNFYKSIFNYITGGINLDSDQLLEEIRYAFGISNNVIPEKYELLLALDWPNSFEIPEDKFKKNIDKIIEHIENGNYEYKDYVTIYIKLGCWYEGGTKISKEQLLKKIKKAIFLNSKNTPYTESYFQDFRHRSESAETKLDLDEIKKTIDKYNLPKKIRIQNRETETLFKKLQFDFEAFINMVNPNEFEFSRFNINKFNALLVKFSAPDLYKFYDFIENNQDYLFFRENDINFFKKVKNYIIKSKQIGKRKDRTKLIFAQLIKTLEKKGI